MLDFNFDNVADYKRIVDFKNGTTDNGLYNRGGLITLFNTGDDTNAVFTNNTLSRLVITRDGTTDLFTVYFNGTQEYQRTDSTNIAVFDQADNIARFFIDDTGGGENPSGFVDTVAIWDGALSASEAASLGTPGTAITATSVPFELSPTLGLLTVGGIWGISRLRKRRGVSKITK